jgi:hypothetical protein
VYRHRNQPKISPKQYQNALKALSPTIYAEMGESGGQIKEDTTAEMEYTRSPSKSQEFFLPSLSM